MNSDVLHPPKVLNSGIGILTLSVKAGISFSETVTRSASTTITFDPKHFDSECLYQIARIMEEEFKSDRATVVRCARMVAKSLNALSQPRKAPEPPPLHPLQQRLCSERLNAPPPVSDNPPAPLPHTLHPVSEKIKDGTGTCEVTLNVAMLFSPTEAASRVTKSCSMFNPNALDVECFYVLARHLEEEYRAERASIIAALCLVADTLEQRAGETIYREDFGPTHPILQRLLGGDGYVPSNVKAA